MTILDVNKHYTHETLVIYDLDNTLIQLKQILGSDEWFYYRYNQLTEKYGDRKKALTKAIGEWIAAQTLSEVEIVEEGTALMIRKQQEDKITLMGLTTRDCSMATCTISQLDRLDIDLSKTSPHIDPIFFLNSERGILYQNGVLFTSGTNKGQCFREFLKRANFSPKRVVFINDKYANIKEVADACYEDGIEFLGLRYGYLDEKIAMFDVNIAEIQMFNFANILSNEEAYKLFLETKLTGEHPEEEAILRATED